VTTLEERFDFANDAREDLLAFKRRLDELELLDLRERIRQAEISASPPPDHSRRSLWCQLRALLSSGRRHREALEREVANLRRAVVSVVELEFAALIRVVKELIVTTEESIVATEESFKRLAVDFERSLERDRVTFRERSDEIDTRLRFERLTRQKAFTELDRRLTLTATRIGSQMSPPAPSDGALLTPSVQSLLESFYFQLEERYRGTREEIKQRLLIYRNDLRAARERTGINGPIIDIGCGRGELLEMVRDDGFHAIGIDTNDTQLEGARRHGVAVVHGDALDYLRTVGDHSVLAVTGVHVVEHIPFTDLVRLMQDVSRVLKPGGVAIFETPNPRNLIVGATTFHLDPTHVRPLPPEVMQILLETVGFDEVAQRPLHPSDTLDYMVSHHNLDKRIATLLFGPQDYAVIGVMK
jgi:SAM-dependent methyltransferase